MRESKRELDFVRDGFCIASPLWDQTCRRGASTCGSTGYSEQAHGNGAQSGKRYDGLYELYFST